MQIDPPPEVDAIVLQAFHEQYRHLDWLTFPSLRALLDGRAALSGEQARTLIAAGIRYLRIGLGQ